MQNKYKVVQDIENPSELNGETTPLLAGSIIEAEPSHPSILSWLEQGIIELIDAVEDTVTGETEPKNTSEESTDEPDEPTATEKTSDEPASDAPADQEEPKDPAPAPSETSQITEKLHAFCMAIQQYEGYFAPGENLDFPRGTRAYWNKNPGNLKFRNQKGSIAEDRDSFAIFGTYEEGFVALQNQVILVANNKSDAYRDIQPVSILSFFKRYDSSKGDNPTLYAETVAKEMGVPVETLIKDLIA